MIQSMRLVAPALLLLTVTVAVGQDKKPEIVSLLGVKHFSKADEAGEIAKSAEIANSLKDVQTFIGLGQMQSRAWRYNDAIATYTRAIAIAPADARLYRLRGHRYISVRKFDLAVTDLKKAAEMNDRSFDIWYHLGLAHYLRGDFAAAASAYEKCYAVVESERKTSPAEKAGRDDSLIAVSDWLYMTYRRLNRPADAARLLEAITPESKVQENKSYFRRLLYYKGLNTEEELTQSKELNDSETATIGYGIANWHLYNGNRAKAEERFRRIVSGTFWPAFGFIAAEVELTRLAKR